MLLDQLKRRAFITLLGSAAAAWPLSARGQQGERMRRIAVLVNSVEIDPAVQGRIAAFRQSLERLGWLEGRNIRIELRFSANNFERLPQLAQEIVVLNPDVIFATTTPAVKALQAKTRTIPIVFVYLSDPVGAGVVASLARPGGNITGLLLYEETITGKWLGMLKEISPRLTRAALVGNPKGFTYDYFVRSSKTITPALGIEVAPTPIENDAAPSNSVSRPSRARRTVGSSCPRTSRPISTAISSLRSRHDTGCLRCMLSTTSSPPAA
jgi:putative tryptophan/tyrosine transport system substrate-binding protein